MRHNLPGTTNGWVIWGEHVLAELERQNRCIHDLNTEVQALKIENAILKVKSGTWGAIGALIPIIIAITLWIIKSGVLSTGL
jgi:hypothetical protein